MRQRFAKLGFVLVAGSGCSLIYNESNIARPPDAKVYLDAAPPDTDIIIDANPIAIGITDVYPTTVLEGAGATGTNSRPAIVIIHGHDFDSGRNPAVTVTT